MKPKVKNNVPIQPAVYKHPRQQSNFWICSDFFFLPTKYEIKVPGLYSAYPESPYSTDLVINKHQQCHPLKLVLGFRRFGLFQFLDPYVGHSLKICHDLLLLLLKKVPDEDTLLVITEDTYDMKQVIAPLVDAFH